MNWCVYAVSIYINLHRYGNDNRNVNECHSIHINDSLMNVRKSPLTRKNELIIVSCHLYFVSNSQ